LTSSIYPLPLTLTGTPIGIGVNIFASDVSISTEQVSPGGGGILRLLFSFDTTVVTSISVFNNSLLKGVLNADNGNSIENDGYYRFDIDVEAGDNINLQSSVAIATVNEMRAHLVQFGA